MEEKISILSRDYAYLKTLSVNVYDEKGIEYKDRVDLDNIIFYNEYGMLLEVGNGYFDSEDKTFSFKGYVVARRKENFTRKENFVISSKSNIWNEKRYTLYIYDKNVDIQYIDLEKRYSNIYKVYRVNGVEVLSFVKNLETRKWELRTLIEQEVKKLESYNLPLSNEEMKIICDNLMEYNNSLLEEQEFIKSYIPKEEDFEEQ